ncbi:MAG: hypothetical protein HY701_00525, partial [Gemmatimonadetes bacterium]|nr:hypothetical protein [Gemmatimonadota bacterium]
FTTVRREGIELVGDFIATVNPELRVGVLEETVTVTEASPIVDVQQTLQQRVFTSEVIEAIPVGRSHINLVVLVPGLTASQPGRGALADVGGTNNLQNTMFVIHGSRQSDTRLQFDGIRMGNVLSEGQFSNMVPDTGSTQEITVDYGAVSAEQPFGGLRINIVPRDGGNTFRGTMFATHVTRDWQQNNLDDELRARGLPTPNFMKEAYDYNGSVGGPIQRDRLWLYSSVRVQRNQNFIAGLYYNRNAGDPTKWLRDEDTSRQAFFGLDQNSVNTRATWQAAPRHKVTLYYDAQTRKWDDTRAGVSPESTVAYRFPWLYLAQAGWTSPMTNRLLFEARVSERWEAFGNQFPPEGDVYRLLIPVQEQSINMQYRGKGGNGGVSGLFGKTQQDIKSVMFNVSYVTGAHAFKGGFTDTWARTDSTSQSNDSSMQYRFNNGIPNQLTMYGRPTRGASLVKGEIGAFAQDRWTVDRWTINLGVRYDQFIGGYPEQYLGPVPFIPAMNYTFPAVTTVNFKDVTPRMGVAYDLFGTGKTALKASLGKYVLATFTVGNPAGVNTVVTRNWTDANRDYVPDCNLLILTANGECSTVSNLAFGQLSSVAQFDPETREGWGTRQSQWEFSTAIQHQLASRLGIEVGYFRRTYGNFRANQIVGGEITSADFDSYCVTAPQDSRLPGGGGFQICDLWDLKPAKVGLGGTTYQTLTKKLPGSPEQIETWNGVDVTVNARLQNGLVLQGGVSTSRPTTDNCDVIVALNQNPSQRNCRVQTPFDTNVKVLGLYPIPRVDVQVAATFQSNRGPQLAANRVVPNAEIAPSLGRNLSAGAQNATINLLNPGDMYGDRVNQFDLRLSRTFRFGARRAAVNLDVYNALNQNPVMQEQSAYAIWRRPLRIMDARMFKVSGQIDF